MTDDVIATGVSVAAAKIGRADPAAIAELHDLIQRAYRGEPSRRGWTHEADLLSGQRIDRATLAAALVDPDKYLLAASVDDRIIACVELTRLDATTCYLGMLSVDPALQANGLGRRLIAAAEAAAATRFGATRIEMTVLRQRTELIPYYLRRGYRLTGEERPFPAVDTRFGTPRRDDLGFVVLEKWLVTNA